MRHVLTLLVIVTSLLCLPGQVHGADLPETAKLLPAEAFAFLTIEDTDQFCDKFEETQYYKLYKDPSMREFFDQAEEKIREMLEEEGDAFSKLVFEDKLCPTGKIAVAVVPEKDFNFGDGSDINIIIMGQWKDGFDKIRKAIEKDIKKQLDSGSHRKKDHFRGAEIVTLITEVKPSEQPDRAEEGEDDVKPEPEKDYYGFYQDIAFYSDNLETLQFTISQIVKSSGATLWDDTDYQAARKSVGPNYDLEIYLNLKPILKSVMAIPSENPVMNPKKIVTTLGVDQLTGIAGALEITGTSKQSMQGKVMVRNGGTQRGIMKMLDLATVPFKPPVFVSPESSRVGYINLNFQQAGDELGRILAGFSPMAAVMMTSPITAPDPDGSPGVVIKTDILDNLGSQIIFAEEIRDNDDSDNPFKSEQLFAIQHKDKERIARAISKIHTQFIATAKPDTQREFLGHTIYTIPMPSFMPTGTETEPMTEIKAGLAMPVFAFTVTDSHVVFATEDAIEQALRRISNPATKGLAQKEWHQYALSSVPSAAQLAGFDNMVLYGKQFWKELKNGMKSSTFQIDLEDDEGGDFIKLLQSLPDFEAIQKYFGLSVQWGQSRDDGLYFESKDLNWKEKDN